MLDHPPQKKGLLVKEVKIASKKKNTQGKLPIMPVSAGLHRRADGCCKICEALNFVASASALASQI